MATSLKGRSRAKSGKGCGGRTRKPRAGNEKLVIRRTEFQRCSLLIFFLPMLLRSCTQAETILQLAHKQLSLVNILCALHRNCLGFSRKDDEHSTATQGQLVATWTHHISYSSVLHRRSCSILGLLRKHRKYQSSKCISCICK
jgi:hypothetical protein